MPTTAPRSEEAHYCARCKALIEQEEAEKKERDSGMLPVVAEATVTDIASRTTLRGMTADGAAPVPPIPAAAVPEIDPRISQTDTLRKIEVAEAIAATMATEMPPAPATMPAAAMSVPEAAQEWTQSDVPASKEGGLEHRSSPRKQVEVDVGIHSDAHFFAGLSGDVSRGGLFVATYAKLAVGEKVTLDFELPNGRIVVEGTVRWRREQTDRQAPGFGVQFENIDPVMLKLVERFCQARPPLYYDQADEFE